jgi:hypothetical protein
MSEGGSRRAVAEIRFGEDRSGLTKVGGRSIHQYWSLLSPHFRDVFLAPQRRSDDGGVAWTWREALEKKPLTAAELAGVRKRLERANESFAENPVNPLMADDRSGTSSQVLVDQVAAKVKLMAESLAAKSDAALSDFVCRTEQGVMVHSWGVASPAPIHYPDAMESGVSGVVLVGGKPAQGHEVVIENAKGLRVARAQSDETGEFLFSKIPPGRYRVRVISGRVKFPVKGVTVNVERGAMTRLELASANNPDEPDDSATEETEEPSTDTSPGSMGSTSKRKRGGPGKILGVLVLVLLLVGGAVWGWRSWFASDDTDKRVIVQASSMMPEAFSADEKNANSAQSGGRAAGDGGGLSASADGVGGARPRVAAPEARNDRQPTVVSSGDRTASTIGSKIDVLSRVEGGSAIAGGSAGNVAAHTSSLSGHDSMEDSMPAPASMVQGAGQKLNPTTSRENALRVAGADSSSAVASSKTGSPGAGASGKNLSGGNPPMSGGQASGMINAPVGGNIPPAQASTAGASPAAKGEAAPDTQMGLAPESPSTDTAPNSSTMDKSGSGESQNKGPKAMTSVVQKSMVAKNTKPNASANEAQPGDRSTEPEAKSAVQARPPTVKTEPKPAPKVPPAVAGQPSASGNESNSSPATALEALQPGGKTDAVPAAGESQKSNDSGVANTGPSSPNQSGASAEKSALTGGRPQSQTERASGSKAQPEAGDKAESSETTPEASEPPAIEAAAGPASAGALDPKRVTIKVAAITWKPRLVRDAIVPTLPVRVGESDAADLSRELLLKEKRDLMPETFRTPVIHYGITLQIDPAFGGRRLHWEEESVVRLVQGSVQGFRVELVWPAGGQVQGAQILRDADGKKIARVVFHPEGNIDVELTGDARAVFWVGVTRSPKDDLMQAKQTKPRFGWQVVLGTAPHLSWRDDAAWPGGQGNRLEVVLNSQPTRRVVVALLDRVSGWSLTGEL